MLDESKLNSKEITDPINKEHDLSVIEEEQAVNEAVTSTSGKLESLEKELAVATAKATENWDRLLRANAEMENVRRRARLDVENANKFAVERFAKELLSIVDSLEKAIEASINHAEVQQDGLKLTYKLLIDALDKFGIKMINPVLGDPFNPIQHEALAMQESTEVSANNILFVAQKGFTIYDRVLRAARVIVAKNSEKI